MQPEHTQLCAPVHVPYPSSRRLLQSGTEQAAPIVTLSSVGHYNTGDSGGKQCGQSNRHRHRVPPQRAVVHADTVHSHIAYVSSLIPYGGLNGDVTTATDVSKSLTIQQISTHILRGAVRAFSDSVVVTGYDTDRHVLRRVHVAIAPNTRDSHMRGSVVDDEGVIDTGTSVTLTIHSVAEHLNTVDTILLEEVLAYCVRVHIRLTVLSTGFLDSYGALRYSELGTVAGDDELRPAGVQSVVAGFRQYDVVRLVQVLAQIVGIGGVLRAVPVDGEVGGSLVCIACQVFSVNRHTVIPVLVAAAFDAYLSLGFVLGTAVTLTTYYGVLPRIGGEGSVAGSGIKVLVG